ncbi:formylmethanofuran--tetrahydromethanopterin N-formyltransferase [Methanocella sp. MCL-LM]|uniref:formylmethanofuran--tetrahydromethanopterin N-formyltransferase n=1 Tax=Methanocella sp. MCL-LM TaxID=3412035 RepID=UPI003C71C135
MKINNVEIEETYAEAFPIQVSRVLITAATEYYARIAATEATGFGTSVIGCPAEAGIDCFVPSTKTPDGRPGYVIMICHPKKDHVKEQLVERLGECVLTAPTTAVFNWLPFERMEDKTLEKKVDVKLHFFGDGFESKQVVGGRNVYAIPIMEGDFICEEEYGVQKGVAGGNFFIMGETQGSALMGAQAAVDAINQVEGCIMPFPGGIVASGSKVGSLKYSKFMKASTNHKMAPTLKSKVEDTQMPANVNAAYEIVIDGIDEATVAKAMTVGIKAACTIPGVVKISAGNYGGKLGPYKFELTKLLQ